MQKDTNTLKPNNVEIYTQREKRIFGVFFVLRMWELVQVGFYITNKF